MNIILFDDATRSALLPFTHTRPVADIRCGILTMRQRWEKVMDEPVSGTLTEDYLQPVYPFTGGADETIFLNASVFATHGLATAIRTLTPDTKLLYEGLLIAARMSGAGVTTATFPEQAGALAPVTCLGGVARLQQAWDIFAKNEWALRADYALLTAGRDSAPHPEGVTIRGGESLFLEEGAVIQPGTVVNATSGPVYIGKGAEVMEGCLVRGPLALCDGATLKMGAKVYGGTTIGPGCKVGGEVSNVVFFANSNKGHDGFLGNAVIGEWCNLGADTNCSNLKNNYDEVKIWSEAAHKTVRTGLTFCGLLMGDHSKCGINTMFNTGTVVGVSCNIWGGGFPEKFLPSFSWGGSEGAVTYDFNRAMDTARRMMARRHQELSAEAEGMYRHVFNHTQSQRDFIFGK